MTQASPAAGAAPLAGITVIELGHSVAAPFAGQILADLGAEVIKIEKAAGDDARHWGPPFLDGAAATFQGINRGKRSWVLDLRDPDCLAQLHALIETRADVVLQTMRPGQVEKLALDAASLRARKPALVYCNLGAFGSVGPLADRPGYDPLMQAVGGIMSVVGEAGGAPVRVGPSIIDMGSGMWAAMGILSLLMRRHTTGEGGVVDVSLFETAACWMTMYATQYMAGGAMPGKNGSGQAGIAPYRAYRTIDGDLVVAAGNDKLFRALCGVVGHPEWANEPRFANNALRVENSPALYALLEACFATQTTQAWTERLDADGVPCAPVQNVAQMLEHPQTQALGLMQDVPGSSVPLMGLPLRLDGQRLRPQGPSPRLGEMNEDATALPTA